MSTTRASLDGTFNFRTRHPGTYRIGYIPDYNPAVQNGPDVLRDIDRKAVTLLLADGQKKTARLVVSDAR